jgi:hypothetical protein
VKKNEKIIYEKEKKKRTIPRSLIHALFLCPPCSFRQWVYSGGVEALPHPMSFVSCQYLMSGFLFALLFCGMSS